MIVEADVSTSKPTREYAVIAARAHRVESNPLPGCALIIVSRPESRQGVAYHSCGFATISQNVATTAENAGQPSANHQRMHRWYAAGIGEPSRSAVALSARMRNCSATTGNQHAPATMYSAIAANNHGVDHG